MPNARGASVAATLLQTRDYVLSMKFDLITLDLGLRCEIGLEILAFLSNANCKTPIIVISSSKELTEEAVEFWILHNLTICKPVPKPIDLKELSRRFSAAA